MNATIAPHLTGFGGAAHGGYVMTLALRAMADAVADAGRVPRSMTMHLLAPIASGGVELDPRLERDGGTMSAVSARLVQEGATVALALASFGEPRPALDHLDEPMPSVAPPERLEPLLDLPVPESEMQVEHRPAAGTLPLRGSERADLVSWMRLAAGRPVDVFDAAYLADSLAPALYGAHTDFTPMPSTDITLHFTAQPWTESPWVLGAVRNRFAGDGYAVEDGELWAPDGRLLLRSRQQRRVIG
jgi:acyl-CoA thioesterase